MCTAATYKTKDFYFGRTLDYEFSYGEEITITPRNYKFNLKKYGHNGNSLRDDRDGSYCRKLSALL